MKLELSVVSSLYEQEIKSMRAFYTKYLLKHRLQRMSLLSEINSIVLEFQKTNATALPIFKEEYVALTAKADALVSKFGQELKDLFNKEVTFEKIQREKVEGFWLNFFQVIGNSLEDSKRKHAAEIAYKLNFLTYIQSCLNNEGLHIYIHQRDQRIYKRFNLVVSYVENRKELWIARPLMPKSELESEYLIPLHKKKALIVNGHIIKYSAIKVVKITTTKLLDDEIELFSFTKNFTWHSKSRDELMFARHCNDETNLYLKNPEAEVPKLPFKNTSLTYINLARIDELKAIKTEFDTSRLITLCDQLNQISTVGSSIAVSALQRTIINYIPPIFGMKNFDSVVAECPFPKSVKKCLENLQNSMKNISDYHMHVQASEVDSLPNMTQVDFSNDLDVLLAEVCKKLKAKKRSPVKKAKASII